jgi:hypothetical protein
MQHLWYGRQAVTRTRSILMAAVFDKAMKRKDFSGVTTDAKGKGGAKSKQISIRKAALESMGKKGKGPAGSSKNAGSGADIGKIVNLMSGDASKVAQILGQVYNIYGAPFEIIVGTFFLYRSVVSTSFPSQAFTDICQLVPCWFMKITRLCGIYWLHRFTISRPCQSLPLEASYIYISRYLCRP